MGLGSWLYLALCDLIMGPFDGTASSLLAPASSGATDTLSANTAAESASLEELERVLKILEMHHAKSKPSAFEGRGAGAEPVSAVLPPADGISWTYLFVIIIACIYAMHLNYPKFFPGAAHLAGSIIKAFTIHPIQNHALGARGGAGDNVIALLFALIQFILSIIEIVLRVFVFCCSQPRRVLRLFDGFGASTARAIGAYIYPICEKASLLLDTANHSHEANLVRQQLRRIRALLAKSLYYAAIIAVILFVLGVSLRRPSQEIDEREEILSYEVPIWVMQALPENRDPSRSSCHYRPGPLDLVLHVPEHSV